MRMTLKRKIKRNKLLRMPLGLKNPIIVQLRAVLDSLPDNRSPKTSISSPFKAM
jgi:hypothetical protein